VFDAGTQVLKFSDVTDNGSGDWSAVEELLSGALMVDELAE
jgi:hypothetical protein